jgi:hypothetical protein
MTDRQTAQTRAAHLPRDITNDLYARTGKLPVWRTIARAWAIVFRRLNIFIALAAIPMALTWLIQVIGADLVTTWQLPDRARIVIEEPFRWIFWTVFSVAWHRYALLGQRDSKAIFQFRLGAREIRFMLYAAVLAIPLLGARVPLLYFGDKAADLPLPYLILVIVMVIAGITIGIRFSFVFPSVSVERKTGLKQSWGETRGSGWRIFWASFLASIPLGVADRLARELVMMMEPIVARSGQSAWENPLGHWMIGLSIAQLVLAFFFTAVLVSVLCIAFRRQTDWEPPGDDQDNPQLVS